MKTDFLFEKHQEDLLNFVEKDLVELKAYGLSLSNGLSRPFLILKDLDGEHTLPVGISQIEAGVTLTQSNPQQILSSPHTFLQKLIESLDIKIEKCVFTEITGNHQFVRIFMRGHPKYQSFKLRADEAMSLCLQLKVPFFATKAFINKSKVLSSLVVDESKELVMQQMGLSNKTDLYH